MLKLCLALPVFYPTFAGGSLRFLRYQPGLRKRGIEARVLAGTARDKDASHTADDPAWDAYPIGTMLPIERIEGVPVHRVRLPEKTGIARTSAYFRALIELCRDPATRPDVIQLHSFERLESLYWLARLRRSGVPVVYAIQIARTPREGAAVGRFLKHLMLRRFYDELDGVVTSSEHIRTYLQQIGVSTPIAVIPNGVDLDLYRPPRPGQREHARGLLGLRGDGPVVLSVGAVSPRKGTDLLVEAFCTVARRHPEAELVLVGPRNDHHNRRLRGFGARIETLVRSAPDPTRIHFTGVRDDLPDVYAAADVVVLPTSREGGTPNVVLEAMACERPVLLTPFEGQSAAIGRSGVEFEQVARTAPDLAAALVALLERPARRRELAERGREWVVSHLDQQSSLDRFADFYHRATEGRLTQVALDRDLKPRARSTAPADIAAVD